MNGPVKDCWSRANTTFLNIFFFTIMVGYSRGS